MTQERVSVKFLVDFHQFNAGESAVFPSAHAHSLAQKNVAVINKHEVRDDTNIQAFFHGMDKPVIDVAGRLDKLEALIEKLVGALADNAVRSTGGGMAGALKK